MPGSTATYPFEYKSLEALDYISRRICGELRTFLITFDEKGCVDRVSFRTGESSWFEEVDQLRINKKPHLFFDPIGVPDHIWVSWLGVRRSHMERLLDVRFQPADFETTSSMADQDELYSLGELPTVWEVMF